MLRGMKALGTAFRLYSKCAECGHRSSPRYQATIGRGACPRGSGARIRVCLSCARRILAPYPVVIKRSAQGVNRVVIDMAPGMALVV